MFYCLHCNSTDIRLTTLLFQNNPINKMVCANSPNCFCACTRADKCSQATAIAVCHILTGEEMMQRAVFSQVRKSVRLGKDFCCFPRIINGKMHYFTLKQYRRQRDKAFWAKPWP